MTSRSVYAALTIGKMQKQAKSITEDERKAVAQWIIKKVLKENSIPQRSLHNF